MTRYRVVFERKQGSWVARVPAIRGCHTHGRTLERTRQRIREALSLFVRDADSAELIDAYQLSPAVLRELKRAREARRRADREAAAAQASLRLVARSLTGGGLSLRDAGELLGLSRQRVHQLLGSDGAR